MLKLMGIGSILIGAAALGAGAGEVSTVRVAAVDAQSGHTGQGVRLIVRDVVEPAATVSRGLSEQPVRPFMAEVKLVAQTIYLDPAGTYYRQDDAEGHLDDNHWILRSQQLARTLANPGVQVIYGSQARKPAAAIEPRMILLRPPVLMKPKAAPQQIELPPAPQSKRAPAQVACAE